MRSGPTAAIWRQSSAPIEPPGAGDDDRLAGEIAGDHLEVELHRVASENVLHLDLAKLAREVEIARDQLVHRRQRLDGDAGVTAGVDDSLSRLAGRRGDRDDHLVRASSRR